MTENTIRTLNLGYPRIGRRRELKRAVEAFWKGELSEEELQGRAAELRRIHWEKQREAGIDLIPSNDFSFYDQVLDMSCLLGNVPNRFNHERGTGISLDLYFRMARGKTGDGEKQAGDCCGNGPELACEMTKWFDTNYHYLVPEFNEETTFRLSGSKVFDEFLEAKAEGVTTRPVLIGPLTYLTLGKSVGASGDFDRFSLAEDLIPVYVEILKQLAECGATEVQIDEPALGLDLSDLQRAILAEAFKKFSDEVPEMQIHVATYFGELRENADALLELPVAGIHIDAVRAASEVNRIIDAFSNSEKSLSLGVIDGRNIWKTNLNASLKLLRKAVDKIGAERLIIGPSCSLLHVPVCLSQETDIDPEIANWLAFADEKLTEIQTLRETLETGAISNEALFENSEAINSRRRSSRVTVASVQARTVSLCDDQFHRDSEFTTRRALQKDKLNLPLFPTTTIGSFPQTDEIRSGRSKFRKGEWSEEQYQTFLRLCTSSCIETQERAGLDVLVHGEFERNDMVEYFGEQLEGFIFTQYGWVQSYGSRCVKPPIIFGDVSRPSAMTVEWAKFAQSKTTKPMKGMLTGPVTILQWSFVRDDQSRKDTAFQIALSIRDEVIDLESAGLPIIQIDEAAIREGLPLRRSDWANYLEWAVLAFRLSSSGVRDETQIHTHMCYSEFNDMLDAISRMDADVITIENARSNLELLEAFAEFKYPNEIGPGVYDIHSPRVPTSEEMETLLRRASKVLSIDKLWVNPDCGLKTRAWEDVNPALIRMVGAAKQLRKKYA